MSFDLPPKYTVTLIAEDGHHYYPVNNAGKDAWLPGVTGILSFVAKPQLVNWAAKVTTLYILKMLVKIKFRIRDFRFLETLCKRAKKQHKFVKEQAAEFGTFCHTQFESYIAKQELPATQTVAFQSFMFWMGKERLKLVAGDMKTGSPTHGYGGSLDALAVDHTERYVVIDFKTGNSLYKEHAYQVAAYAKAFQEQYGLDYCPGAVVVRFDKEKVLYERREIESCEKAFEGFLAAKKLSEVGTFSHFKSRETVKPPKIKGEK